MLFLKACILSQPEFSLLLGRTAADLAGTVICEHTYLFDWETKRRTGNTTWTGILRGGRALAPTSRIEKFWKSFNEINPRESIVQYPDRVGPKMCTKLSPKRKGVRL